MSGLSNDGIKKKKPGFRPGFAGRVENDSGAGAPAVVPGSGGGLLAGLSVHEGADDAALATADDDANVSVEGAPDFSAANAGMGGMLAGLVVHDSSPEVAPAGILQGLMIGGSAPAAPVAGGFSFMSGASAESSSALPTPLFEAGSSIASPPRPSVAPSPPPAADSSAIDSMQAAVTKLDDVSRSTRLRIADLKVRARELDVSLATAEAEAERAGALSLDVEVRQDAAVRAERFEEAERLGEELEALRAGVQATAEARVKSAAAARARVAEELAAAFAASLRAAEETNAELSSYSSDRALLRDPPPHTHPHPSPTHYLTPSYSLPLVRRRARALQLSDARHIVSRCGEHAAPQRGRAASLERVRRVCGNLGRPHTSCINLPPHTLFSRRQHVAADTQLAAGEAAQVESAISEQTDSLEREAAEHDMRHAQLIDEVAALERALLAKRAEERASATALADARSRIANIRAKFDKQQKRLAAKRALVDKEQAECDDEAAALAAAKAELAAMIRRDRTAERSLARQARAGAADAGSASSLVDAMRAVEAEHKAVAAVAAEHAATAASSADAVKKATRGVRAVAARMAALEAQAAALEKTQRDIDAKVPELNVEKKAAVESKKFKEAQRVNEELKRLSDAREVTSRELTETARAIDEAEHEKAAAEAALASARADRESVRVSNAQRFIARLETAVRLASRLVSSLGSPPALPEIVATIGLVSPKSLQPAPVDETEDVLLDVSPTTLGIEVDFEKATGATRSLSTTALCAVELLKSERDVFLEELVALAKANHISVDTQALLSDNGSSATPAHVSVPAPVTVEDAASAVLPEVRAPESPPAPSAEAVESVAVEVTHTSEPAQQEAEEADETEPVESADDGVPAEVAEESAPTRDPAEELAEVESALNAIAAAVAEKEAIIGEAVGREDYDTAGSWMRQRDARIS